ncbi:MAG: AAA family ATPase [Chloroflexi bacterium]|nr:AAA family ATPase [Chloroflexota bacterium]
MIKTLEIKNFKSIKHLPRTECKRVNILIGQPNAGKSNILEALGLLSFLAYHRYGSARDFVRFERVPNLFYDEVLDEPFEIHFDDGALALGFKDGRFSGSVTFGQVKKIGISGNYDNVNVHAEDASVLAAVKSYRYAELAQFTLDESDFLKPPSGNNLMSSMMAHRELRVHANELFSTFGLRLSVRPQEHKIEVIKQTEDITISYPYSLASDTLKRVIFFLGAILTNKDSVLVFEEPEAHAFPFYTKELAETIALDQQNNQYFLSTHNPYLLMPLMEKTPVDELSVFVVYFENFQTRVKTLTMNELREITEIDVLSNIDRFIG